MRRFLWETERLAGVASTLVVVLALWFAISVINRGPINWAHAVIAALCVHVIWGACDRAVLSTASLARRIRHLEDELREETDLRERLGKILEDTANALHGGPLENGWWSFHDLPELSATMKRQLDQIAKDYVDSRAAEGYAMERLQAAEKLILEMKRTWHEPQ